MSETSENGVKNAIFDYLVMKRALAIRVNSGAMAVDNQGTRRRFLRFAVWRMIGWALASAGVSDILACYRGRFVAIECKSPGKLSNLSKNQTEFLTAVRAAGGNAIVADSVERLEGELLCKL